ncbi:MAG: phosphopyruvate hydratase, partial [Chloroflexi bacterium]|nr:phosphopyruvate hydratase [Chloroflexota bacterium]
LLVTQQRYVDQAIQSHAANAVLVKVNQVGTVTETLQTIATARAAGWGIVISHRSGETEDTTIADLVVGTRAGQLKAGAPARSDRVAKYNRLLAIADELGGVAEYAGRRSFR